MNFSKLRHRITFQKITARKQNSMGEDVPVYADHVTVWGAVEPLRGREYSESQRIRAETTYRITVRYLAGITPDMRIIHAGRTFEIQSILNIEERNIELQIIAAEQGNGGQARPQPI